MSLPAELYKWGWTADGVGNPVWDGIVVGLGYAAHKLGWFSKIKLFARAEEERAKAAAHRRWQTQVLTDMHHEVTGRAPAPHPEHGQLPPTPKDQAV